MSVTAISTQAYEGLGIQKPRPNVRTSGNVGHYEGSESITKVAKTPSESAPGDEPATGPLWGRSSFLIVCLSLSPQTHLYPDPSPDRRPRQLVGNFVGPIGVLLDREK